MVAYIPTESRKAGSTKARGGRETEKDNENVSCKNNTGEWTPIEAHLAPLYPLMDVLRRIEIRPNDTTLNKVSKFIELVNKQGISCIIISH